MTIIGGVLVTGILTVDDLYVDGVRVSGDNTSTDTQILYGSGTSDVLGDPGLTFNNITDALRVNTVAPITGTATWYLQNVAPDGSTTVTANNTTTTTEAGEVIFDTNIGVIPTGHGTGARVEFLGSPIDWAGDCYFYSGSKSPNNGCTMELWGGLPEGGGSAIITADGFEATGKLLGSTGTPQDVSVLGGNASGTNNGGDVVLVAATNLLVSTEETTTGLFSKVYITTNGVEYRLPSGEDVVPVQPVVGSVIGVYSGGGTTSATTEGITISGGASISSTGVLTIASQYITTAMIASGAVTSVKIADASVGPAALEDLAVTPGSYAGAAITVDADGRLTAAATTLPTVTPCTYVYASEQLWALGAVETTLLFDTVVIGGTDPAYNAGTGVFTLTAGKFYRAIIMVRMISVDAIAHAVFKWQDASSLATVGVYLAVAYSNNHTTGETNSPNVDVIISGSANPTVRVRIVDTLGTCSSRSTGCAAIIYQIGL